MDYTSLLHLLSSLSWNVSSESVDYIIPICSNTNKSFKNDFYIYHDDFSQKSLSQYNCSCYIVNNGNKSKVELQHFTFINKKNTMLHLHYDSNKTEDFRAKSIYNCSTKQDKCYINMENGTIHFTENGEISQFLFKIEGKGDSNISLSCNQNSSEITHPDIAENKKDNYTLYDQLPLLNSNDNNNHGISVYVGWALTGIGSLMLFIALTIFMFLRNYRQKKEVNDKVSNTQTVTEIIPEKTDIQSAKVSESKPCEEDYEFCEINEYYTICKDEATSPYTAPNLPSKPPPIKQNSVDLTDSSVTDGRNSQTEINQGTSAQTETNKGTSAQTERYSNYQLDLKSVTTNQGEKTNQKIVNSNHSVDGKSDNQSVPLQTGQSDYDNVDDFEDTYNHLDDVFSPLSLNSSSTDNIPNKNSILAPDTIGGTSEKGNVSTGIETKSNNQADTDIHIVILDSQNKSETKSIRKHGVNDHTGHESVNDDVILRTAGSCSIRSHSDTKLLDKSDTSDFDKVVCELVQRSKSCNSTIDTEHQEMIIIENDLYESVDGYIMMK